MAEPRSPSSGPRFTAVRELVSYVARYEEVTINRHHLLRILDARDKTGSGCPRLEWSFVPLAMFLGLLAVLLTADFRDAFGTPHEVWHAWAILVVQLTGIMSAALFIWWAFDRISHALWRPHKTSDQIIDEIIGEMDRNDAAFEARHQDARRSRVKPDAG